MKFKKALLIPLMLLGVGASLLNTACQPSKTIVYEDGKTPITDSFKFKQANDLEGKRFAYLTGVEQESDHYGYVTLKSCTDGDTANFVQEDYKDERGLIAIKTRFLGINTPESTAKVEPWGKPASNFTKKKLEAAQAAADEATSKDTTGKIHHNIVLINHPSKDSFEERDSSGNRWLAFIWYRLDEQSDWRNLNLELVETGYSKNQLFVDDPVCNYRSTFEKAEKIAAASQIRVHGQRDDGYDYEERVYETSIWGAMNHYEELGITEEGSSGLQLRITALVVGIQGDNMFLRDVCHDKEQTDDKLWGVYAYAGYNSSLCSLLQSASKGQGLNDDGVGVVVRFYCRATTYSGNVQLSDLKTSTTGKKAFVSVKESNFSKYAEGLSWSKEYEEKGADFSFADLSKDASPVLLNPNTISSQEDLGAYQYSFVQTIVKIRKVTVGDRDEDGTAIGDQQVYWYKGNANDSSYTVYAEIAGKDGARILTNLRIDTSLFPFIEPAFWGTSDATDVTSAESPVGKSFKITGYVSKYFDKYQIMLPNNYSDMNYISALA